MKKTWPWVEKYRPHALEDIIAQGHIVSTLNRLMAANKLPHLLFYGPPGTGKTSTIIATAKKLFGHDKYKSMVLELNASDDRGIQVVRNQIKEFAGTKKLFCSGIKLIILDEADSMTNDAQFALRRVIEKYTKNARFCLVCNYVSKIIPALQSRCTRFRFGPLSENQVGDRIRYIADAENVNMTEDGFSSALRLGKGDMRRILNILQATSMAYDVVDEKNVYLCTGNPLPSDIEMVANWLLNETFATAYEKTRNLQRDMGYAVADILSEIYLFMNKVEFPAAARVFIFDELAQLEHRLAFGTTDAIQLASLVGIFGSVREMMQPPPPTAP